MKILKIWPSFQTELKYHDHYLADEMNNIDIQTTFLSSDKIDKEFKPFLKNKNIKAGIDYYNESKIIRLKSFELLRKPVIVELYKMYKEIRNNNYQIIHIFGIGNFITFIAILLVKLTKKNIPIIINDHTNPNLSSDSIIGKIYYKFNTFIFSKLKKDVDCIITPNLASNNFVKEHYSLNEEKLKIIPLGYDPTIFNYDSNKKNKEESFVIGFAGKILPGKKLELLIDSLSEIKKNNIKCIIVGLNEELTEYQQELISYSMTKDLDIEFRPLIKKPSKLADFYNYIDLAIFTGSISITTLEANGCGTPIILYESIIGLEDRIENNRGILFKTNEELKNNIIKYLSNKESIDNKEIEKETLKYSWPILSKKYVYIYREALKNINEGNV